MTEKNNLLENKKLMIIIFIIIGVVCLISLALIKFSNPQFPLGAVISIGIVIVLFFIIMIGIYTFWQNRAKNKSSPEKVKDKKEEKLPPAITIEQARELAIKQLKHPLYADYPNGSNKETNEFLGKNVKSYVYSYTTIGEHTKQKYVIIMNRHYPNETLNILIDPSDYEINKSKLNAAFSPDDEPDVEITERKNPLLGTEEVIRKETRSKVEKKNEEKKEDL